MTIVNRTGLGRPLTWSELDGNFSQVQESTAAAQQSASLAAASQAAAATSESNAAQSASDAATQAEAAGTLRTDLASTDAGKGISLVTAEDGTDGQTFYNNADKFAGAYEDSTITIDNVNSWITYDGVRRYVKPGTSVPFTTSGTNATSWATDQNNFTAIGDVVTDDLTADTGVELIGCTADGIYLGCFFDSQNNNEVFIVTSEDGYNWSNATRIYYQNKPLTVRDPTLIFYKDSFLLLEGGTVDVADCYLYVSKDLFNWTKHTIIFNTDGVTPVFSSTKPWSNGGGTVACSKSWAQEPTIDSDGNLYIMSSFYTGVDTTQGSATDNQFKIGISKCSDWDTLAFEYPTLIDITTSDGAADIYSRIDPSMHYDATNDKYVLGVKRENYGYVELFQSETITGTFSYLTTVSPPANATATTMMFEGPSVFGLRNGGVGISVDDYYGGSGQWLVESTDLATFTSPTSMRMPFARHGSVRFYDDFPLYAEFYILRAQVKGSSIRTDNIPSKFMHYTESQSIEPIADAIYWTSTSGLTLTVTPATSYPAKRFFVFLNNGNQTAATTISGSINGGDVVLGYGVNNYNMVEFVYNNVDKKYIAAARYNPQALFTSGTMQANNLKSNTGLDLGNGNTTAGSRQITAYTLGTSDPTGNIAFSDQLLSVYSNGEVRLKATTFVSVSGNGLKFPSIAVGSLPSATTYPLVETYATGLSTASDGTTAISPSTQKVYSDGTNWRLSASPSTIVK